MPPALIVGTYLVGSIGPAAVPPFLFPRSPPYTLCNEPLDSFTDIRGLLFFCNKNKIRYEIFLFRFLRQIEIALIVGWKDAGYGW